MLKLYDHLDALLEQERQRNMHPFNARHLFSELVAEIGYADDSDIRYALTRSFEVCCSMHIPIEENFKRVYRYSNNQLQEDWQLSDLGCYLLIINGKASNPNVAKAQLGAVKSFKKTNV